MTRLSLFLLLGVLITFSSAALAGHKTRHGGHNGHHNGHHGHQHYKHHNRHIKRHHRPYGRGGHHQSRALFSFSYGHHRPVNDQRSYPYNGYLYSDKRRRDH